MKTPYNIFLYLGFILLGAYHLFYYNDLSNCSINLGIALLFDPFNQNQPWAERPTWQKAVLFIQVGLVFGLMIYDFIIS